METTPHQHEPSEFTDEQEKVFNSIRSSRIILPMLIGLGVVGYLMYKQFDPEQFALIQWTRHTLLWISFCLFFLALRHFAYMTRLYIITKGFFSWRKCFELIFIWEFSSAVSPTSIGGSAVALVVLSLEKLSAARTAALVLYTIVLDTSFFIFSVPILYLILGNSMIAPSVTSLTDLNSWGVLFIAMYGVMVLYGSLFSYGLLLRPRRVKQLLLLFCRLPFLKRFKPKAEKLGDEIIIASKEIKSQKWSYHVGAFLSTMVAWSCRFILLYCLIIAFVEIPSNFLSHLLIYSRLESMYVIMQFIPTPGGAGAAEFLFGNFLSDYVPQTLALTIALIWRLFSYYIYLAIGAIVIPNWIRQRLNERKKERLQVQ